MANSPIGAVARAWLLGSMLVWTLEPPSARASEWLYTSSDVGVGLDEVGGGVFADEDVAVDGHTGVVVPAALGNLPPATDVAGYEQLPSGDQLLCFDGPVELPGPVIALPGDIVRYDGSSYAIEFDASANGIPDGVVCDAIAYDAAGRILVSFDVTVEAPDGFGGTLTAADEDLLQLDGPGSFSLLDTSAAGVPDELDLDAAHLLANGNLAVSFDRSGQLGGVVFDDEDVVELDPGSGWSLLVDGSAAAADWESADLDALALPEPGALPSLAAGVAFLLLIGRRRTRGNPHARSVACAGGCTRSARRESCATSRER